MKNLLLLSVALLSVDAMAQNVPPLPGKIAPGTQDTQYFVCSVSSVNEDTMSKHLYGHVKNLWTVAAVGGKFEALSTDRVRVMAPDVTTARNDLYAFYQKYAAAAFIRSPLYDSKGARPISSIVESCVPDSSRATVVNVATAPKEAYVPLDSEADFALYALRQLKSTLPDDKLVFMYGSIKQSNDAFERQELVAKHAQTIKGLIAKSSASKLVKLSRNISLPPYAFDTGSFDLSNLKGYVEAYSYSYARPIRQVREEAMPIFDVTTPASMRFYKPKSAEEAKLIERERAAALDGLRLVSYIQVSDAEWQGRQVRLKGVLASIEVLGKKGNVLFTMSAK